MKSENQKVEVKKIDIKVGDQIISLKPEQAKELKKILNEMFEEPKTIVVHEHHHDRYWWNWPTYCTNVIGTSYSYSATPQTLWTVTGSTPGSTTSGDITLALTDG